MGQQSFRPGPDGGYGLLFLLVAGRDPVVSAGSTHISPSDASATVRPAGQPCRSGAVQGAGHETENLVGEAGYACPAKQGSPGLTG